MYQIQEYGTYRKVARGDEERWHRDPTIRFNFATVADVLSGVERYQEGVGVNCSNDTE